MLPEKRKNFSVCFESDSKWKDRDFWGEGMRAAKNKLHIPLGFTYFFRLTGTNSTKWELLKLCLWKCKFDLTRPPICLDAPFSLNVYFDLHESPHERRVKAFRNFSSMTRKKLLSWSSKLKSSNPIYANKNLLSLERLLLPFAPLRSLLSAFSSSSHDEAEIKFARSGKNCITYGPRHGMFFN